jgi:polygalacturonase
MSSEISRRVMLRLSAAGVADRIVASVRCPWFPGRYFPVTDFGAKGDGTTLDTQAFAKAIAVCHRVSQNPADYLPVVFTRWQGIELMNYSPFVYCYGQHNVAVTGAGTLNGQADANHWWNWKNLETNDFDTLETMADDNVPVSQRVFGAGHYLPPQMIQPFAIDTVLLEGVTVINSPFWHLNPNLCTNVTVDGLTISSTGPNTDGCDPESCDGVVVQNVTYDTGDDCMAIKSGRDADGRRVNVPCQNVVIQNCNFANGHGGITIGSEMTGGVKNVYARDLTMNSANLQGRAPDQDQHAQGRLRREHQRLPGHRGHDRRPAAADPGQLRRADRRLPAGRHGHHARGLDRGHLRGPVVDRRGVRQRPDRHCHTG